MEKWLTRVWYGEGRGGGLLLPLSALYALIMAVRRWAYQVGLLKTHRVAKPVVIVGNLTVGGTGKTPLVIWLARRLEAHGLKVAIVSRGYGSSGGAPREVSSAQGGSWREVGDEPVLLSRRSGCRVFVSPDRVAAARAAVESGADVIVSDDGLQHLRLARDCEIAVIDGARGLGNQRILPAGPLRESARRLSSVDLVVMNGAAEAKSATQIEELGAPRPLTMKLMPTRVLPVRAVGVRPTAEPRNGEFQRAVSGAAAADLDRFRGSRVHAVAGIGNPSRFFNMLRAHGIEVIEHPFPDHHPFAPNELIFADELPVLMTEKDAVRAAGFANDSMSFIPVDAEISEADAQRLLAGIDHALNASQRATR